MNTGSTATLAGTGERRLCDEPCRQLIVRCPDGIRYAASGWVHDRTMTHECPGSGTQRPSGIVAGRSYARPAGSPLNLSALLRVIRRRREIAIAFPAGAAMPGLGRSEQEVNQMPGSVIHVKNALTTG